MSGRLYTYKRDSFATPFINTMRWTCLFLPVPIALYTAFATSGIMPASPLLTIGIAWSLTILFFVTAAWNFLSRDYSSISVLFRLSVIQATFACYLVFVCGFTSPVVFTWLLFAVMSDVFFGIRGVACSLAMLVVTSCIAISLGQYGEELRIASFTTLLITLGGSLFVILIRSITRREHLELERTRIHHQSDHSQLVTILNSISVGIASTDAYGTLKLYNAAFLSLLDTNTSLGGKNIDDVLQSQTVDGTATPLMDIVQKSFMTHRDDLVLRYSDDEIIRLGILINPIRGRHNKLTGYIFIVEDITKEKNLDEERDEFISVISHELRTPITIAEGSISNAQLLLDRGADPSLFKKMFEQAHEQIVFLANMVNDLGTLSRAERGVGDTIEDIDIDALAHELYNKYGVSAKQKGLHLNLDLVGHIGLVATSRLYLEEVLQNFITNAIKYTQKGTVTLCIRRTKDGVNFAVKDTGIGISKTDLKRIFEKFYRSEDYRTRETSGTGLGLYVVQKLARKLGTTIEVTSQLNHGSAFSFTLPLVKK